MPLRVAALVLQSPPSDLEQAHRHPRPNLRQLYTLIPRPHKYMMPHLNTILDIFEGNDPVSDLLVRYCSLSRWEKMF